MRNIKIHHFWWIFWRFFEKIERKKGNKIFLIFFLTMSIDGFLKNLYKIRKNFQNFLDFFWKYFIVDFWRDLKIFLEK